MIQTENINLIWASLIVEECLRKGADTFFLAPGARCTPLTLAVARHPDARTVQHVDERGLGYASIGFSRATGRPGVVICTSGTAVSNLTPAVVEAAMDGLPLLLLTADRPFELRECGANQSIPQSQAFTPYVEWSMDLSTPDVSIGPQVVLTTLDRAFQAAGRGPVHLNCPYREPLAGSPDRTDSEAYLIPVHDWTRSHQPYTSDYPRVSQADEMSMSDLVDMLQSETKVLVVVGGGCQEADSMAIEQVAERCGWPIISDISSGLHFGPRRQGVVRHIDAILAGSIFPDRLEPTILLQFGSRFLSKTLLNALESCSLSAWVHISRFEGRFDPLHRVTHRFVADMDRFCLQLEQEVRVVERSDWKLSWLQADMRVEKLYEEELDDPETLSEPALARLVSKRLRNLQGLVLGASMPIRDMNQFSARNPNRIHVACNRGASGIDGTVATAVGFARGLNQGVTVVLGDLAALHDLNSLAMVAMSRVPVIVVVVNNHGGGIFHFLPQAGDEAFETFFGTPHTWKFEHAADQFDLPYAFVETAQEFDEAYQEALDTRVSCVIEVETDRKENLNIHRMLEEKLDLPV